MVMNDTAAPRQIKLAGHEVELLHIAEREDHALSAAGLLCEDSCRLQMLRIGIEGNQRAASQCLRHQDRHSTSATPHIEYLRIRLRVDHLNEHPPMSRFVECFERL